MLPPTDAEGKPKPDGMKYLVVSALFLSVMMLSADAFLLYGVARQLIALDYPTADGAVTASQVVAVDGDEGQTFHAEIKYAYRVGAQNYAGDRYRYAYIGSGIAEARRIVAAFRVGKQVTVYYAPSDAADAVLLTGIEGLDFLFAMFLLPFNAMMLGNLAALRNAVHHRRSPSVAGGVKIWSADDQIRARLSPFSAGLFALGGVGLAGFLGVFLLAGWRGFNPPIPVVLLAWCVVGGCGLAAYLLRRRNLESGTSDLVIDEARRTVTLPRTCGRRQSTEVPADRISAVIVEDRNKNGAKERQLCPYVPTLIWRGDDGTEHREKLAEWMNPDRAEQFAAWLRTQLKLESPADASSTDAGRQHRDTYFPRSQALPGNAPPHGSAVRSPARVVQCEAGTDVEAEPREQYVPRRSLGTRAEFNDPLADDESLPPQPPAPFRLARFRLDLLFPTAGADRA